MLQSLHKFLLGLTVAIALPVMAQSDPPARVGRLAHIENQVNFRLDPNDQGGPATINWPVSSGAVLETGQRGRAEVWIGSSAYRLADDSQIEFSTIDDARVDVRVNGGSLAVSILDRDQVDDVVVVTPDGNVRFLTPGRYRINVLGNHSELSVQAGRATFDDGQRVTPVAAGQRASRWSDGNAQLDADRNYDAFDSWVANRENLTLAGQSRRLVSPRMTGYQDLDAYGDWRTAPDYGSVWYPRAVADDWAPYRYGRWAWVAPWGWTWIDQAPWGFAPFHYGRWAIIQGRWGWIPGRIEPRPVYAPALVAWVGNPGWSVGFTSGAAPAVGWFPLAPREVYVPSHRYSSSYVRQLNVAHVRDLSVIDRAGRGDLQTPFANRELPRAVTVVPANMMRDGRSITAREIQPQARAELGRAPLAGRAPNADWLAPAPGAVRPHSEERRDFNRPHAADPAPRNPDQPAFRQPMPASGVVQQGARPLPEVPMGVDSRRSPPNEPLPAPPQRREVMSPAPIPPAPAVARVPADAGSGRESFRRSEADVRLRPPEAAAAPIRRDMPAPEVRMEVQQPRPVVPQEIQRIERPAPTPREREVPQMVRQPEVPRQAAEVRMPAPPVREMAPQRVEPPRQPVQEVRAPPPVPAPAPQPRAEPPRQPAPQGGGQPEQRRRHGNEEERGGR
jgi:hypothetical protein